MAPSFQRPSGLNHFGSVPWGTHFWHLYESDTGLYNIVLPFLEAGYGTMNIVSGSRLSTLRRRRRWRLYGKAFPILKNILSEPRFMSSAGTSGIFTMESSILKRSLEKR